MTLTCHLLKHFSQMMETIYRPQDGTRLAVGVSGGADSLCTALLAQTWASSRALILDAVTVDHGLRPESSQEALQVSAWMSARGLTHTILRCPPFDKKPVTQGQARTARYRTLASWCTQQGIQVLILGHHADDQLETFLMRLDHASGPDGLACMAPRSTLYGLTVLRPLLEVRHHLLTQHLLRRKQSWIEDPSNQDPRFARTRYRAMLQGLEAQGWCVDRVLMSIQKINQHKILWTQEAEDLIQKVVQVLPEGLIIQRSLWCQAPQWIQKKALRLLIQRMNPDSYPPKHHDLKLDTMLRAFQNPHLNTRLTLGHCLFCLTSTTIDIQREKTY